MRQHVEANRALVLARFEDVVQAAVRNGELSPQARLEIAARAVMGFAEDAGRMVLTDPAGHAPDRYVEFVRLIASLLLAPKLNAASTHVLGPRRVDRRGPRSRPGENVAQRPPTTPVSTRLRRGSCAKACRAAVCATRAGRGAGGRGPDLREDRRHRLGEQPDRAQSRLDRLGLVGDDQLVGARPRTELIEVFADLRRRPDGRDVSISSTCAARAAASNWSASCR